jgi:hypothetical protein
MHHLLGFNSNLFNSPYGAVTDENTIPSTFFWNRSTLGHVSRNVVLLEEETRFPIKLITSNARKWMKDHYVCESIDGIPLENGGIHGQSMSHFDKTVVGNDLVSRVKWRSNS